MAANTGCRRAVAVVLYIEGVPIHSRLIRVACKFAHLRGVPRKIFYVLIRVLTSERPSGTPNALV